MRRFIAAAVGLLLSSSVLVGCTGDEESPGSGGGSGDGGSARTVPTSASLGTVVGKLGKKRRKAFLGHATTTVDKWLDAAYVAGEYPRSDFGKQAFPRFTPGATNLARKQPKVMSNAAVGERVDRVTVKKRRVTVDVLAPGGRPAGATARVVLVMELDGEVQRTDRVRGRLMLTPQGNTWKVFGFDMERNVMGGSK